MQAERLGLVNMLVHENGRRDPERMARAIDRLPEQKRPSEVTVPGLLDGLDVIQQRFSSWLAQRGTGAMSQAAE